MRFDFLYDRRRRIFAIGYRLADAEGPGRLDAAVLRPAGLGGAARQLRRHRQGRRAAAPLVPPRAPRHQRGRPRHADVVGRHDVRVPDAAAADAHLPRHAARSELPRERAAADRVRPPARRAVGHLGVGLRVHRPRGHYQYKAFGVPGLGLKRGLSTDLVVAPYATALASLVTPAAAAENLERLAGWVSKGRFGFYEAIDYNPRGRDVDADAGRRRARRGARLLRAPPGHVARGAGQRGLRRTCSSRASTPIPACRPPSSCCRSACRARRSCRSRGRPKARRRRRRCPCSPRAGSGRRTRPACTPISFRTGATRPR
jgi:cyclic beta-1,2-glucan synthetase